MINRLFLVIGAMKAGTTWTYSMLSSHPLVHFTPEKEIHFIAQQTLGRELLSERFRQERKKTRLAGIRHIAAARQEAIRQWYDKYYLPGPVDINWYNDLFANCRRPQAWRTDFSNLTSLISLEGWRWIKTELAKKVRVLYVLRDPIERLWSHYKFSHLMAGKGAHVRPCETSARAFLCSDDVLPHARYSNTIMNVRKEIGSENLLVLFFETIRYDPLKFLRSIEDFLTIKSWNYQKHPSLHKKINPSTADRVPPLFYEICQERLDDEIEKLLTLNINLPNEWF